MNELDERYMKEALAEARLALESGEVPVGAIIVYKGNVIGRMHPLCYPRAVPYVWRRD